MKRKKGFTIVELLMVIVVLAIVLGLAVVAYIGLRDKIDVTYYKNLEESLTISGTDYFYYNKEKAPSIFGEQTQVPLSFLKENNYIEDDVLSSNGEECNLNDSYVGAYKNSLDETKYYVCLKCGNYETDTCSQKIDYTLNVRGQVEDTKENYDLKGDKWVNKNIILTFETVNDIKQVHVTGNNFSKICEMNQSGKIRTCKVTVEASGTYNYYGSGTDNDTEIKSVKVLIDKTSPTFDIENTGTNNKIEIETTTLKATINNTIKNILDNESGIKTIEYSLVKEGEKDYYHKVNNAASFNIKQEVDLGKYKLRIRVYNNANLVTIKEIDYDIYKKTIVLTSELCNKLSYNGENQILINEQEGFTFNNNLGLNAGDYNINATLKYGYRWSDGTTGNKTIVCGIEKKNVEVTWSGGTEFIYNGKEQGPTATVVSGVNGETLNITNNKETNAGKYTSTVTLNSVGGGQGIKENYNLLNTTKAYEILKATPTLTLSATSGSVNEGSIITFTGSVNPNVSGTYKATSNNTGVATVSVSGNTISVKGVSNGSATITVDFTPSDTANYNNATSMTYSVTGYKIASVGSCQSRTYTGGSQTLMSEGVGVSYVNNERTQAGSQTVTINANSGYRFSDNTTSKTQSCSIAKANPVVTLTPTSGIVDMDKSVTFKEKANIKGKFENVSSSAGIATVSPETTGDINANTDQAVTVTGQGSGNTNITVTFTPSDTTNYNNKTATYSITVNAKYCANFYENGATSISGNSACCTVAPGQKNCSITSPTITRDDWTIVGWGTSSNSTSAAYTSGGQILLTAPNTNFYAVTYRNLTLTIAPNMSGVTSTLTDSGGVYNTSTSAVVTVPNYSTSICKVSANTNRVYQIEGLSTTTNGSVNYCSGDSITLTDNLTLYALWRTNARYIRTNASCVHGKGGVYGNHDFHNYYLTESSTTKNGGSASGYTCKKQVTNVEYDKVGGKKCTICTASSSRLDWSSAFPSNDSCKLDALSCTKVAPTAVANGTAKIATVGSCNNLVYNGETQNLASGGSNIKYEDNQVTNAGDYYVTAKANNGYVFSDGSDTQILNCSVDKKNVTVNYSSNNQATAIGVNGEKIELETNKNNNFAVSTMKYVNQNYSLKNTVSDSNSSTQEKTTYKVNYYLMNQDKVNYSLANSTITEISEGVEVTGLVKEYEGYLSPKEITIKTVNGENVINYYYKLK